MQRKDVEKRVIDHYQQDERNMILIFAQWCINHELDPVHLYQKAYPNQLQNPVLNECLALTVPKAEADIITDNTVLQVLQLFGNHDLAFVVQGEIDKQNKKG